MYLNASTKYGRAGITGFGLVSPYGIGWSTYFDGLCANATAIGNLSEEISGLLKCRNAGVCHFGPIDGLARLRQFASWSWTEAIGQGGDGAMSAIDGMIVCSMAGTLPSDLEVACPSWCADRADVFQDLLGRPTLVLRTSAACATTSVALGQASQLVRSGIVRAVAVVGVELLSLYQIKTLDLLNALSVDHLRPFDRARSGTLLGEGAGVAIVESEASIDRRNVRPLAWLMGGCNRVNASSNTGIDNETATATMRACLQNTGLEGVDYVHAHATGTPLGDLEEADAICNALATTQVPISAHKGGTGHLLFCSGFLGLGAALGAIDRQQIPPTPGLVDLDPNCRGDVVMGAFREAGVGSVLVNNFGFFGNYSSFVLSAAS